MFLGLSMSAIRWTGLFVTMPQVYACLDLYLVLSMFAIGETGMFCNCAAVLRLFGTILIGLKHVFDWRDRHVCSCATVLLLFSGGRMVGTGCPRRDRLIAERSVSLLLWNFRRYLIALRRRLGHCASPGYACIVPWHVPPLYPRTCGSE